MFIYFLIFIISKHACTLSILDLSSRDARHRLNSRSSRSSRSRSPRRDNRSPKRDNRGKRNGGRGNSPKVTKKGRGSTGATGPLSTVTAANTTIRSLQETNKNFYKQLNIVNDVEIVCRSSFQPPVILLMEDRRTMRCPYMLPRDQHHKTLLHAHTIATCSSKGNHCGTCSLTGGTHALDDGPRVVILADEYFPAAAGHNKDCLIVWRIEGGTFNQFKALINAQIAGLGLKLKAGSVVVSCLMTHLFRLGEAGYWNEWNLFADWLKHEYKLTLIPALSPYPTGLPFRFISAVRRFYGRLQHRNFGSSSSRNDPMYSLWRPLYAIMDQLPDFCLVKAFSAEPLLLINKEDRSDPIYLSCDGDFLMGAGSQDQWNGGMPSNVEKVFLNELIIGIRDIQTNDNLITPDLDSIISGLNRESSYKEHEGRTIFILGASNMEKLAKFLLDLSETTGIKVVSLCEGGDFLKYFLDHPDILEVLKIGKPTDILFINPIGNNIIAYKDKEKKSGAWHLKHPKIISDQKFNELMVDMNHAIAAVHGVFSGTSILMGPYPRMLRDCCMEETHWLRDDDNSRIDMLLLNDVVTDQMHRAASLPDNFGFVSSKEVFGRHKFNVSLLSDNVYLTDPAQIIVANFMVDWLDKSEPIVGKVAEGENLPSLSEALRAVKIHVETAGMEMEDDVFEQPSSARKAVSSIRAHRKKEAERRKNKEKAAAAAAEAAAANSAADTASAGGSKDGALMSTGD